MSLMLQQNNKINTSDIVDNYISAEIPNPDTNSELHNVVIKNIIHCPCGDSCRDEKGKSSKHFPKRF